MTLYVIGIPQFGGCWLCSSQAFRTYAEAEEALAKDRLAKIDYTRIFTFTAK